MCHFLRTRLRSGRAPCCLLVLAAAIGLITGCTATLNQDAAGDGATGDQQQSADSATLPDSASARIDGSSKDGNPSAHSFVPCVIDVSKVGASCSAANPTECDGADIAQNYSLWPDPYACFVCGPGVTLLKGSRCDTDGVTLVWNSKEEQCILNGQGYPLAASHGCSSGRYAAGVTAGSYNALVTGWYRMATIGGKAVFQPNAGADAYVVDLKLEDGKPIQAAVSFGHGVLDGKCGDTFLVKVGNKYVLLLQTDIRSWSLELSPGANTWLDSSNVGGTCIIPEVRRIDSSFVANQFP